MSEGESMYLLVGQAGLEHATGGLSVRAKRIILNTPSNINLYIQYSNSTCHLYQVLLNSTEYQG